MTLYFGQFSQRNKGLEETAICSDERMLTILSTEYENSKGILRLLGNGNLHSENDSWYFWKKRMSGDF